MKFQRIVYVCDGCQKEASYGLPRDWFVIPGERCLCCECGHFAHQVLNLLGVKHEFVCHQYADTDNPGYLEVAS